MSDILLTYSWVRSSYATLRNLHKHNIKVIASDSRRIGMCQFSRLKEGFESYCSHYEDEERFIKDLINICKKRNIGLIFPSHNETEIIARHKDKFDKKLVALIPHEKHCRIFNNKASSYNFVKRLGIPVPKRLNYDSPSELRQEFLESGIEKVVIKLLTGNSAKGVFYAESPQETESIVQDLINQYNLEKERFPQVEEYVTGEGYGSSVLYWQGKCIANFTHRRLRDKVETGGTSTLREASKNELIENAALKIFDAIGWHGLAMSEFKVCSDTGKFWFIEVNPRMWGSIPLAIEAGVEFPYLAWLCANKGPEEAVKHHKKSKIFSKWKARWLLGDIFVGVSKFLKLDIRALIQIIFEERADSVDDFFWDDPLSFLGELISYAKNAVTKNSINPKEEGMIG